MKENKKAAVAGFAIGAAAVTTLFIAGTACLLRHVAEKTAALHLFDIENQEDMDDQIDALLPIDRK